MLKSTLHHAPHWHMFYCLDKRDLGSVIDKIPIIDNAKIALDFT